MTSPAQKQYAAAGRYELLDRGSLHLVVLLHGLGDRSLIPVGISMGAAVGLHLAVQHPERVAGAVLIRPSFGPDPWPAHLLVFRTIAALLRSGGPGALPEFQQSPEYRHVRDESVSAAASLAEQFTKPDAVRRVVRLETVPGNTAVDWKGKRAAGPPLTIVGAHHDPGHPLAVAQLWQERLAGSALLEIPSRDQQPEAYAAGLHQIVTDAVAALTPAGGGS
jgi:pimeloyl-ACP methyl ester carboxylesterase